MKFWQVDAFTKELFSGNPAAVFIFDHEPNKKLMAKIAREMNLSETAFVIRGEKLKIRWFTPGEEVKLCGHATLAAAHILWQEKFVGEEDILFQSRSGPLTVSKVQDGYTLNFPQQPAVEEVGSSLFQELNPLYIGSNGEDCMVVVASDTVVRSYTPDFNEIAAIDERGFLLTAPDNSKKYDYIYRGFFPKLGVPEDPVTGSANTCLAPYWSKRLNKNRLFARQVSERGGELHLELVKDRLLITGQAITVFTGDIDL